MKAVEVKLTGSQVDDLKWLCQSSKSGKDYKGMVGKIAEKVLAEIIDKMVIDEILSGSGQVDDSLLSSFDSVAQFIVIEESEIEATEKDIKARRDNLDNLKDQFSTMIRQSGLKSVRLSSGLTPGVTTSRQYFRASGVNDEWLYTWLRRNRMECVIKSHISFQALQETLSHFESNGGIIPQNIIKVSSRNSVRMNGKSKFLEKQKAAASPASNVGSENREQRT